jgi:23S rRNA (cytosine1962-C5)-methyltransferase
MLTIKLGRGADKRIRNGHPWIFSNEISRIDGEGTAGSTSDIYSAGGDYLGRGYHNPSSLIAVRLLTRNREDIDTATFYRERITRAVQYRQTLYPGVETFRAVYGEGDFLPGLVVDKYGDYLSLQLLTAGIEARKELIIPALHYLFAPKGIVARNDVAVRGLEGLTMQTEVLYGDIPDQVEIEEHGLRFGVSLLTGQKTGHFLDQKENHLLLKEISVGKEVLDCFSYSGSWGIHAAAYGATSVTAIDSSEKAVSLGKENAARNGFSSIIRFETGDAFERLRGLKSEGRRFDLIVLDPPAFIKSRKLIQEGLKGYLTINRRCMELLNPGGRLLTCSCSHHLDRGMFQELLLKAAVQSGREMRLLGIHSQSPDHPVLLAVPETEYLKCFILQASDFVQ